MSLSSFLLDLIFPPRCKFCGTLLDRESWEPCRKCNGADFWLEPSEALLSGEHFARCVCAGWYQGKLRDSLRRFKFEGRQEYAKAYGPLLAKQVRFFLPGAYDLISWVPVSPERRKERGYDQAQLLAQETAGALGKEAISLLAKVGNNRPQSSLDAGSQRWKNVAGVYAVPDAPLLEGKRVLLIDDILTTGATLEEAAKTLLEAGAAQVVAAAFCRTPTKEE